MHEDEIPAAEGGFTYVAEKWKGEINKYELKTEVVVIEPIEHFDKNWSNCWTQYWVVVFCPNE